MSAQTDYPFPWNPDADLDGWVSVEDLLQLLTVFNSQFEPDTWETDSISAAVVLDGNHNYFQCQSYCNDIEGNWRMADLDAFGRHFDLASSVSAYFWVNGNDKLNSSDFAYDTYQLYGPTGDMDNVNVNNFSQAKKCMCYIQSSPFVPSQYTEDSNLALWSSVSYLQEQVDSLTAIVSSGDEGTNQEGSDLPIGTILAFASDSIPEGWMFCDGAEIAIDEYQELYDLIGTTYGAGDSVYWAQVNFPAITFNLPDFRGRTLIACDAMGGNAGNVVQESSSSLGAIGGGEMHLLQPEELPSMELDFEGITVNPGGGCSGGCSPPYIVRGGSGSWYLTEGASSVSNGGGDQALSLMQPFAAINYILKVQ
jgi:microcystin-dependent protein